MSAMAELDIGLPRDVGEFRAFLDVVRYALFFPEIDHGAWLEREGRENVRVARLGGEVTGGLILQPMGQWFGGRSVPMSAVRVVGVAPQYRGSGVASRLMRAALEEMHASGKVISTLFPATQPVYRRAGYEQAGVRIRYRVHAAALDLRDREARVRPEDDGDAETIRRLYTEGARRWNGLLDRNEWYWQRLLDPFPQGSSNYGYIVECDGRPEGYILYRQRPVAAMHRHEIDVADWVALTPRAMRRLLCFLADHRSMVEWVNWYGPPVDPILVVCGEQRATVAERIDWMLRVVDVRGALEARGYARGLMAELHLEIGDEWLPSNAGRCVLHVADGAGRVEDGGHGDLRMDTGGLAALYTGHLSPGALRAAGLLEGPDDAVSTAASVFSGPAPWMPDIF